MLQYSGRAYGNETLEGRIEGRRSILLAVAGEDRLPVLPEDVFAQRSRLARSESLEFAEMDIAQVAGDVHGLVIADQRLHPAAGLSSRALQRLEVPNDLQQIRPPIGDVAKALICHWLSARAGKFRRIDVVEGLGLSK